LDLHKWFSKTTPMNECVYTRLFEQSQTVHLYHSRDIWSIYESFIFICITMIEKQAV